MMISMHRLLFLFATLTATLFAADTLSYRQLAEMAGKPNAASFSQAFTASLSEKAVTEGTAVIGEGPDFLSAVKSTKAPDLYIDDVKVGTLQQTGQSGIWFYSGKLRTGTSHNFYYMVDGRRGFGKSLRKLARKQHQHGQLPQIPGV
jgi:hypothetical protein